VQKAAQRTSEWNGLELEESWKAKPERRCIYISGQRPGRVRAED
jgi:hypothetical protein